LDHSIGVTVHEAGVDISFHRYVIVSPFGSLATHTKAVGVLGHGKLRTISLPALTIGARFCSTFTLRVSDTVSPLLVALSLYS
jgi:hypothetical protein